MKKASVEGRDNSHSVCNQRAPTAVVHTYRKRLDRPERGVDVDFRFFPFKRKDEEGAGVEERASLSGCEGAGFIGKKATGPMRQGFRSFTLVKARTYIPSY